MDPSQQTLAASLAGNPIPRKFPLPETPLGPPPVFSSIVAAPVLAQVQELMDPIAAQISRTIRGALAGAPDALRAIAETLPSPGIVLTGAGLGLGVASIAAGVSGKAAALLAGPAAAIPYVGGVLGPALAVWGTAAPIVQPALALVGGAYGTLGQMLQGVPNPVNLNPLVNLNWGQLLPDIPSSYQF